MNSIQESTNELNAAIRYAENAITSAKQTIESMQFRQDMAKKQHTEQTGREQALEREVAINTAQANAWKKEYDKIKDQYQGLYDDNVGLKREVADLKAQVNALEQPEQPTMPVIPKDVAIAIFREGIKEGVYNVCDELDDSDSVEVADYILEGGFEVHFTKYVDLTDHINTDWMRGKVGKYEELNVTNALKGLCETKKFECRIHGIDDNPTNK